MKDRVREIRKSNNLSQVEMADLLGVSQSVISLIESGQSSLSLDLLSKISTHFNVSCDWLIFGTQDYVNVSRSNDYIPLVDRQASAGYVDRSEDDDYLSTLSLYKIPGFEGGNYRIFTADGDSMEPSIANGDQLIVEKMTSFKEAESGLIYVFVLGNGIRVKRLQSGSKEDNRWLLQSDNGMYRDEPLEPKHIREFWLVRSKLTQRFADYNSQHTHRLNNLEKELEQLQSKLSEMIMARN